ncbi:2-amino-4-hydroxy-6-hydroxymethyldihydropteridine diphosphokinase (plasmid) [Coraliomargarita sp. W4R53]
MSRRLAEGLGAAPEVEHASAVTAVVALGANLGNREETMREALEDLARLPLVDHVHASAPIESVAVKLEGPDADAPAYLNAIALVTTRLAPSVLLDYLHAIENRHGRERREQWGDRTLDLDIIAYGDVRSDDPSLVIPHPRAVEREFVLVPWVRLDPDAVLPGHGRVDDVLERLRAET